jgi:hypothetical protein
LAMVRRGSSNHCRPKADAEDNLKSALLAF